MATSTRAGRLSFSPTSCGVIRSSRPTSTPSCTTSSGSATASSTTTGRRRILVTIPTIVNQGDVLPIDAPPIRRCAPGEEIEVEISSSHFSRKPRRDVTLHWRLGGIDSLGWIQRRPRGGLRSRSTSRICGSRPRGSCVSACRTRRCSARSGSALSCRTARWSLRTSSSSLSMAARRLGSN